jgi:hypothetical protein
VREQPERRALCGTSSPSFACTCSTRVAELGDEHDGIDAGEQQVRRDRG